MQTYSNPKRASDHYSLPDVEVFYMSNEDISRESVYGSDEDRPYTTKGFYYWSCFPGCLPDSDPIGPFETQEAALADAQSEAWQFEDEE